MDYTPCSPACTIGGNSVVMAHFDIEFMSAWVAIVKRMPVFIPLRHPARSLVSFERRGTIGSNAGQHIQQWNRLMTIDAMAPEVMYLHLDDESIREDQADAICSRLDLDIDIDWSVNAESGSKCDTHDIELTDEMIESIPSEFIDFYFEKR